MSFDSTVLGKNLTCHVCGAKKLNLLTNYSSLLRVASDCVPWRSGGRLGICAACNCVQNPVDSHWQNETTEIYSRYQIYRQSAGSEQGVFSDGIKLVPRSAKIFPHITSFMDLEKTGRLLDIGCANGELLRYFSTLAPHWKMVGFEIDDKRREEVESIPGVEAFASGSLNKLTQPFDIITLMHVLEHLANPILWLDELHRLLTPNGLVLIQVPDPKLNPYNLLVADHCSHFTMQDLINIAQQAGYQVLARSDQWVTREFSILIKPLASGQAKRQTREPKAALNPSEEVPAYPEKSLRWLHEVVDLVKTISKDKPRGIWGTAIAATWAYSIMNSEVDFFVDEDIHRIGQQHLGRPIYSPNSAPQDSHIFIALTPEIAKNIFNRWSHLNVSFYLPPNLVY